MPRFKHVTELDYEPTFRTSKVSSMFDVEVGDKLRKEWDINLPIEEKEWQVGLIVGASGSGKTTIANNVFNNVHHGFEWKSKCLLDDFPEENSVTEITEILSKVGFSSPPQWLLPYGALSNGQKFRVELARCLLEYDDLFVFDEFTSVVDRQVAQIGAFAFQKAIRKTDKKFVAVTCHYDVEEWLQPDWVLDVSTGEFKWGCLWRPEIKLEIFRVNYKAWELFKGYHYLNKDINRSSRVYVAFLDNSPVALSAVLPFPHPKLKNTYKEHRTVVVPDFQGVGIGNMLSDSVAQIILDEGKRYISTTSHPAMIHYRMKSTKWRLTKSPKRNPTPKHSGIQRGTAATNRLTASFEFLGE